jgi:hypothetical protein
MGNAEDIGTSTQVHIGTRGDSSASGFDVQWMYRRAGIDIVSLAQPDRRELEAILHKHRPAVVHLIGNLVETGTKVELVFGSRRSYNVGNISENATMIGDIVSRGKVTITGDVSGRDYVSRGIPDTLSVSELSKMIDSLDRSPLVVLDVPTPQAMTERLRQLFLRNAFAAEWASFAPPAAILATGLADPPQQGDFVEALASQLRAQQAIGEIASAIRNLSRGESLGSKRLRREVLPFVCTALFTDQPEQTFEVK